MKIKGKYRKIMIIGILLIIVIAGAVFAIQGNNGKEVETYTVKKGDVQSYIEEIAVVKSNNQRMVFSEANGKVLSISKDVGDKISAGDVIVKLDTENIDLQIKSIEFKLDALNAAYTEAIKKPEKEFIDKVRASVESVKISVEEAKRNLENSEKLYEEGALSYDEYQKAINYLKIQQEALKAAENELKLLEKGTSENIRRQYEAQIDELENQLQMLKQNKENYLILSPIDGTILDKFIEEGALVQPGMPVVEIGDENDLYLEADILASEIGKVVEGADVIIYSEDLDLSNIKGKVRKIYPKAFSKLSDLGIEQKRVRVEINIAEEIAKLKIGYEVDIKIVTNNKKNVIIIPDNSIIEFEDGKYVYVLQDGTAKLRKIETGVEGEDMVEIISGLKEGEKVVLNPETDANK